MLTLSTTKQKLEVYLERAEVKYPSLATKDGTPAIDSQARILKDAFTNHLYTDTGYKLERVYKVQSVSSKQYACEATQSARIWW
jgi:hypothetical protein